jgi:hypothetical protein
LSQKYTGNKVFRDATFQMSVRIEGAVVKSDPVLLKVKQPAT